MVQRFFLFCSLLSFFSGSAQIDKGQLFWLTYMESRPTSEKEKLGMLLLNRLYVSQPTFPSDKALQHLSAFYAALDKQGYSRDYLSKGIEIAKPIKLPAANPFSRIFSELVLEEWYGQNETLYKNAGVKYTKYLLNEDYFKKFEFKSDVVYEKLWELYLSNPSYRNVIDTSFALKIRPGFRYEEGLADDLGMGPVPGKYMKMIDENGHLNLSFDSLRFVVERDMNVLRQNLVSTIRKKDQGEEERQRYLARRKKEREEEEKLFKKYSSYGKMVEKLFGYFDERMGRYYGEVASHSLNVYEAWSKWQYEFDTHTELQDLTISSLQFGGSIVSAGIGIYNLFSSMNSEPAGNMVLQQIAQLREDIFKMHRTMNERFDVIDRNLETIFNSMNRQFNEMLVQLEDLNYITTQTRNELFEVKKQLFQIEQDIINQLQNLSAIDFKTELTYYLDFKKNFVDATLSPENLRYAFHKFADWGVNQSKGNLYTGTAQDYTLETEYMRNELRKYSRSHSYNLNYFIAFIRKHFNKQLTDPASTRSDLNLWSLGSEAFLQLALDWKDAYRQQMTPNLLDQLIENGEELRHTYRNILYEGEAIDRMLFNGFSSFYLEFLDSLQAKYTLEYRDYLAKNKLNADPAFSIWKLNKLPGYKIKFPQTMKYDENIYLHIPSHKELFKRQSRAEPFGFFSEHLFYTNIRPRNPGLELEYPDGFNVTTDAVKYADILFPNTLRLSYKFFEGITGIPGGSIDTDPGRNFIGQPSVRANGIMNVEGRLNNYLLYNSVCFIPCMYYINANPNEVPLLAPRSAAPRGVEDISYGRYKTSYKDLFELIWNNNGDAKKIFDRRDSVIFDNKRNLRAIETEVHDELLRHQSLFFRRILNSDAEFNQVYQTIDGAREMLKAYLEFAIPNIFETNDSLRNYFYGENRILDAQIFRNTLEELEFVNDSILVLRQDPDRGDADSVERLIRRLYNDTKHLKKYFTYETTWHAPRFYVAWKPDIFWNEVKKVQQFNRFVNALFDKIGEGSMQVNYPKVDILLSKLYHLRWISHPS